MRINIYAEEITNDHELITAEANGNTFYGLRIFLKSAPELHNEPGDDDRTAITFWHTDPINLANLLRIAAATAEDLLRIATATAEGVK